MVSQAFSCTIIHEIPKRLRIKSGLLYDPDMDAVFLEALISGIPGVEDVRLNIRAGSVAVWYNGEKQVREKIIDTIEYPLKEIFQDDVKAHHPADAMDVAGRSILSVLTAFLPDAISAPITLGLALPVLMEGIETLVNKGVKVEVLDAAAIAFSLGIKDYFTASSIVALLSLGNYLEEQSEEKSSDLLKNLLQPKIEQVWVERSNREIQIDLNQLIIGDLVVCGAGELISVDGIVAHGEALINQSSITGESLPIHVQPKDNVLSGSVVEEGRIKINARQVGTETGMARINKFLEQSLKSKSQTQKKSDELADKLVPITFALGLGMYAATKDLVRAASVLTVDYSCAIKLATPVAVKMSMYTAARQGVLLKGSEALDALARVDTFVFDKTGTLTKGILSVTDLFSFDKLTKDELLAVAAGAEEHYTHPVANAVVKAAKDKNLTLPDTGEVDFIVAHGVSAYIDGKRVLVGSRHFIEDDEGIDCTAADRDAEKIMAQGKSLLYVAKENVLAGIIALQDKVRKEAPEFLDKLKRQGVKKIVVLTGDHRSTAMALAEELDAIDEIHWELKPEDKADIIEKLKDQGAFVAFAGDGVNDVPAMVTADIAVCMPQGSDIARDSAQILLLKEDLGSLLTARYIAEKNQQTIKNCFKSAVGINSFILALASSGRLAPVTSAVLHNSSTVGILGYAAMVSSEQAMNMGKKVN